MRGFPAKLSILSMVVLCAAAVNAQSSGAMVYAHGNVTLNGQAPGHSTTIFAGDRLDTADSSVATINRNGSSVVVNPNSSIQYKRSSIQLVRGTARVSTLSGMSAEAGAVTITPQSGKAKFDVVQSSEGTVVTPREGTLTVREGSTSISLQPGQSKVFAANKAASQQAQSSLVPQDQVQTFETALNPELNFCSNLQYCLGQGSVSQIHPCRCR